LRHEGVGVHLTAKGKIGVSTSYTENFYTVRNKWPYKLTVTTFLKCNEELCTDDY